MNFWFEPTREQKDILETLRDYLKAEVAPGVAERDKNHQFPFEQVKQLGELGVMGAQTPEQYGGSGLDTTTFARIVEEIAYFDGSLSIIVASHNSLCQGHILIAGNEEHKKTYLPELATGQKLGAWGLTEPASGSDSGGLSTMAVENGDHFVINGSKVFITQGSVGGTYVIMARTDQPRPGKSKTDGISAFVMPRETAGLKPGRQEDKLGLNASDTSQLLFEEMKVPKSALMGQRGEGFKDVMRVLDGGRIGIAAMAIGLGRAALDTAAKYALDREQFGHPIADFQGISFKLAQMATDLEAAKLLCLKAATLRDAGKPFTLAAAQAKFFASEVSVKACDEAIQILGGYGYIKEYPVERFWRDARLTRIGEGSSEIQQLVISREFLKQYR